MATKGSVRFIISAETAGLNRSLKGAERRLESFGSQATKLGKLGGGGLGTVAAGLVSIGGAAEFLRESATATLDLYKASKRLQTITGMDVQTSSAWVSLAKQRGIGADQLTKSYTGLAKQIRAAQQGSQTAITTFGQLGISQKDLAKGDTAALMGKIADGMRAHADGTGKAAVASQLFGRSYAQILPLLNKGGGALRALIDEEKKHGGALHGNAKLYDDSIKNQRAFQAAMEKLKITLGTAVLPAINSLTIKFTAWIDKAANKKKIEELVGAFVAMGKQIGSIASALAPVITGIGKFVGSHPGLMQLIGDAIAIRLAVKAISFANPLRGLGTFTTRLKGIPTTASRVGARIDENMALGFAKNNKTNRAISRMSNGLGRAGRAGGARFAVGFLAMLGPAYAAVSDLVNGASKGNNSQLGRGLFSVGGMILGGLVGGVPGAAIGGIGAGMAYDALGIGGDGGGKKKASGQIFRVVWSDHGRKLHRDFRDRNSADAFKQTLTSGTSGGSAGDFTFSPTASSGSSSQPKVSGKKSPDVLLVQATKVSHWHNAFDRKLGELSNRLWSQGIDPHSKKGAARRISLLQQAIAAWPKNRAELLRLLREANDEGHHATAVSIRDFVHKGDYKQIEYKANLNQAKARANAPTSVAPSVPTISAAQLSEEAFIRAAFAPGDIGSGGLNAFLAAGGVPTGLNSVAGSNQVNITIQSLHPGDSSTKAAIASTVVSALSNQPSRQTSRSTVGA